MSPLVQDRRRPVEGSIVSENDCLRLRVVNAGATLGLVLDARNAGGAWVAGATSAGVDLRAVVGERTAEVAAFYQFEPISIRGVTRGVLLRGALDGTTVLWWAVLDPTGPFTRHRITVSGARPELFKRLTQRWYLSLPEAAITRWPQVGVSGDALIHTGSTMVQAGATFVGLAPDLEEGEPSLCGMDSGLGAEPFLEYGVTRFDNIQRPQLGNLRFAYALCFDARALPGRGFQQLSRFFGARPAVTHATVEDVEGSPDALPVLPDPGIVIGQEPPLEALAPDVALSRVAAQLKRADEGDWGLLDAALDRLDWLLMEQCVYAVPEGGGLGSFPDTPAWRTAAPWMPHVLWEAFRITGIPEYAHRGIAALGALPPGLQVPLLARLRERFGDVYLHADAEEAIPLSSVTVDRATFFPDAMTLNVHAARPIRVVGEGRGDVYRLVINGHSLGRLSVDQLRAGIVIPA